MLKAAWAVGLPMLVVATPALALPINDFVTVQLIDVCDGTSAADSTRCAPVSINPSQDLYNFTANPAAATTETIWQQAGTAFTFLPTINKFYDGNYLTTTADGTPTDQAHQLVRDPGHGQNAASGTLNLYFVDSLTSPAGPVYGYGLIGSNGAVVSSAAQIDAIAHELGHNLGLIHIPASVPGSASDLMLSVGRTVPTSLNDITSGRTDQLTSAEITTAQQPLFTVKGASAQIDFLDIIQKESQDYTLSFAGNGSGESLVALKLRYLNASSVLSGNLDELDISQFGNCYASGTATLINGTNASSMIVSSTNELTIRYFNKEAPITGGLEAVINLKPGCITDRSKVPLNLFANSTLPFSFEFDFSDGVTSTGLYDATTGIASSTNPITVGFIGQPTLGLGLPAPSEVLVDPADILDPLATSVPEARLPWIPGAMVMAWQIWRRRPRTHGALLDSGNLIQGI